MAFSTELARLALGTLALLVGCDSVRIPPPYTAQELARECERHGAWWRDDTLTRGFCEMPSMN